MGIRNGRPRRCARIASFHSPVERLEGRTLLAGNPGDPDPSFGGGDGFVSEPDEFVMRSARDVAAAAGGKLVTVEYESTGNGGTDSHRVVQYKPDGTRDASFGTGGVVEIDDVARVAVRADGKVLAGGARFVVRLNADGSPDASFAGDGRFDAPEGISLRELAVAPGDRIVSGFRQGDDRLMQVLRLTPDGALDTTFSGDGMAAIDPLAGAPGPETIAGSAEVVALPDGRIAVVGSVSATSGPSGDLIAGRAVVAQFTADGSPDPTFGGGDGVVVTEFPGGPARAHLIALVPGGKLVTAGLTKITAPDNAEIGVARYNADGSLDTTFSGDGLHQFRVGIETWQALSGLDVQADGRILLSGYGVFVDRGGALDESDYYAVRLTAGGEMDPSWDGDGLATTNFFFGDDRAASATLDSNGQLIVVGQINGLDMYNRGAVRYLADGRLDTSFSGDGRIADDFASRHRSARAVVVQPDGKTLVGGTWQGAGKPAGGFKNDFYLTRYNTDGSLDATFGTGGRVWTDFAGRIDQITDLLLLPDGKIVAAGSTIEGDTLYDQGDVAVARYNADGSLDRSFDGDGKFARDLGADDYARDVALRGDGDLIVNANSRDVGEENRWGLLRINANGSLDNALDGDGVLFHAHGEHMTLQPDGKIVLAGREPGDFLTDPDGGMVVTRLNADGFPDAAFDGDGRTQSYDVGGDNESSLDPQQVIVTGDKILVLAIAYEYDAENTAGVGLYQFNADGSLDTSFGGGDGHVLDYPFAFARTEMARAMAVDSKGRIVVVGETQVGDAIRFMVRYLSDGSPDTSFGDDNGRVYSDLFWWGDLTVGPDDKPVSVGPTWDIARALAEPEAGGPGGEPPAAPEVVVTLEGHTAALIDGQSLVEFGHWTLGQSGASRRFIVRNSGDAPLTLGPVTLPEGYTLAEPLAATLAPGESDGFTVTLDTSTAGDRNGAIAIATNDGDENPFNFPVGGSVVLPGSGPVPDLDVAIDDAPVASGAAIDFGSVVAGTTDPERTVTIRNLGDAVLTVLSVSAPAGYTVYRPLDEHLVPEGGMTIRIRLSAAAAGAFAGALAITTNDPDTSPFTLNLTGVVTAATGEPGEPGTPPPPSGPAPMDVTNVTAKLPSVLVAGDRRARGSVAFTVTNTTNALYSGPMTFAALASTDTQAGSSDTQLVTATWRVKLKAGATRTIRLKIRFPQTLPEARHHVLVTATAATPVSADAAAGPQVNVQAPFVRLTGLPAAAPAARPLTFGKRATFTVPLQNAGNVPTSRTPATYTLIVTRDGTESTEVFRTTATGRVNLKPNAQRPQRVPVTFQPGSFPAGRYTLIIRLSADLNQTNGDTVALVPFTIA